MLKKIFISTILITISTLALKAQVEPLELQLRNYMDEVRQNDYPRSPNQELYSKYSVYELLPLLREYIEDSVVEVRSKAYYLAYKSTYKSNNKKSREEAVNILLQGLNDEDHGNVSNILNWLTNYRAGDFNQTAKDTLQQILHRHAVYPGRIIRLVGFAGLPGQKERLKNNLNSGVYHTSKTKWAAHLALARMGDSSEVDFCVLVVKRQPVNDDVIYELIPDLIYTRNKTAFDYIVQLLMDDTKNCYSSNPENPQQIACGYRIMEFLAPVIKDFPVQTDSTGDLIVEDYKSALNTVREWFDLYQSDYTIIKDTY